MAGQWQWTLGEMGITEIRMKITPWGPYVLLPGTHTPNWHPLSASCLKYRRNSSLEEGQPEDFNSVTNPLVLVSRNVRCPLPLLNAHKLHYRTEDALVSVSFILFLHSSLLSSLHSNIWAQLYVWHWVHSWELDRHCPCVNGSYYLVWEKDVKWVYTYIITSRNGCWGKSMMVWEKTAGSWVMRGRRQSLRKPH